MAASELDVPQLSSFCSISQASINALLDAPTAELVQKLLQNISVKISEYNDLDSERLRSGVELEASVRGQETKNRSLKTQLEKSHQEVKDLQQKLKVQEDSRTSIENELHNLQDSTSTSASEISSLKARIDLLEGSNRDTVSLLDSKNTACDRLAGELDTQHQKTVELRQEVSVLEQSLQEKQTSLSSASSREQVHKESIAHLERRNDFLENELKAKAEEHTKFRKDKNQQILTLDQQNEDETTKVRRLEKVEAILRRTLEEVSEKAEERSTRIQKLQEEFSHKEKAFHLELDATNRLAKLRENSASTERERAQDLSDQMANFRQRAIQEISELKAELETEHLERRAAEEKVGEFEVQIEHLRADIATHDNHGSVPSTLHRDINGFNPQSPAQGDLTPRGLSPGSSKSKVGFNMTQLVGDNNELKRQLNIEKRTNEQLTSTIDGLMADMEEQSPEIQDLRTEHERLQSEVNELASLVDAAGKERDRALREVKKQEGQVEARIKEGEVLRQQLRDLSSQVKMLLFEAHLREQGRENISMEERAQLDRLAHGQNDLEYKDGLMDTDKFINANLVSFRNIAELQKKNENLLKITREIGERLENDEVMQRRAEAARNWEDLQNKYERCKDEIKSLITQSQSYIQERDMFRRMLNNRSQLPQNGDYSSIPEVSVSGDGPATPSGQPHVTDSVDGNESNKDMADYTKLLKDMQDHFDAYRNEAATDRATMKEQIDDLSRTSTELRAETVRSNSQVVLTQERYEMLQVNYGMLRSENTELQKRSQTFYENVAKQELRTQQAAEDLVEARALENSLRSEVANLKAEKEFSKTIEKRINNDNESLLTERSRLNSLNASLQKLLNEREHSDNEMRRRLQARIDTLEADLQRATTRLREETEEAKRSSSRQEYEHQQSQKRVDDLISSLGQVREDLAKANTTKDHLSRQIDEMTIELRSAKERLEVLHSAPIVASSGGTTTSVVTSGGQESSLSHEQELSVRVSELQRDFDLASKDIEDLKSQVDQYKAISQASEDELNSLNETQDLYRQENDKLLIEKDVKIKELTERIEEISTDLIFSNTELDKFRNSQSDHERNVNDQRKDFENRLTQLQDQFERQAAIARFSQEDVRAQASIAQQAQQNYENELVKHGDATKALQNVRGELNEVKIGVVEARTDAETARLKLRKSEESWTDSKERFEREISELRTARQNLKTQNDHLHQQLETLTTAHKQSAESQEQTLDISPTTNLDSLQEVVKYLRREKEIVDVQFELASQEAKRLKQQLDYTQTQLDDSRLKFNQQQRAEADRERSAMEHNKLMETIHDLNTHRESNMTLRAESRQAQATLAIRNKEIDELRAQLEPLREELLDLKGEREAHEGEIKLLKENADRWQQRAQNVLQKYDRIDPAELDALKDQAKFLETERDELLSSKRVLQEELDTLNSQVTQVQEQSNERVETMKARLTEQFKSRSKTLSDRIREKDAALQTAVTEKQDLEQRLVDTSELQAQLDAARVERDAAVENGTTGNAKSGSNGMNGEEEGEVDEIGDKQSSQAALQASQSKLQSAEAKSIEEEAKKASLQNELTMSKSKVAKLEADIAQLENAHETISKEISDLRASQQQTSKTASDVDMESQVDKLKKDLAQAQQDAESLRTAATVKISLANTSTEQTSKPVADQVAEHVEEVRKELERRHDERVKSNDENYQKRVEAMKTQLNRKLTEGRNQIRQNLSKEHEQAIQLLKAEHEQTTERLQIRHKDEIDELRRHEETSLSELRATLEKEFQAQAPVNGLDSGKVGTQASGSNWQPTEQEARSFVQSNDVVKAIVKQNIISQVNKQKDELLGRLKAEHEKHVAEQLASAQERSNTVKEHAVMMEGKKTALQMNMANNKARIAQFKIDIVQKAAQQTPQKAVKEVWDDLKDAKPPQAAPSQQTQQQAVKPPTSIVPSTTFGQPTPIAKASQVVPIEQPTPKTQNTLGASPGVLSRPTPAQPSTQTQLPNDQSQQDTESSNTQPSSSTKANPVQRPITSGNPQMQSQNSSNQPNTGSALTAPRPLQSGLPVARGGAVRGNPRGRGSGALRGGPSLDTSRTQGQPQGRGSLNSASLNPSAKQFVPGNKRPREESQDGSQGGSGSEKRIRGGGAGS